MDDLERQIRAWTDAVSLDQEPVTADEARRRAVNLRRRPAFVHWGPRILVVSAAAALVIAVVVATGVERGEQISTERSGNADEAAAGPVVFEVLADSPSPLDPAGAMRSAFSPEGLDALWASVGLQGPVPPIDFDTHVVVSMAIRADCGAVLRGFTVAGSDLTPDFADVDGADGCGHPDDVVVVSLERDSIGEAVRLVLPRSRHLGPADLFLEVSPPIISPSAEPVAWPNHQTSADRSSPEAAARSFMMHLTGQRVSVERVDDTSSPDGTVVKVRLGDVQESVLVAPSEHGWVVIRVASDSVSISGDSTSLQVTPVPGATFVEMSVETDLGAMTTTSTVEGERPLALPLPAGTIRSIATVQRDGSGAVLAVTGQGY